MSEKIKFSIGCVDNGNEFVVPKMDMDVHEQAMDDMVQYGKLEEHVYNKLFNKHILLIQLKKVDKSFTLEKIRGLHPVDYAELFDAVWNCGRTRKLDVEGVDKSFQKP